MMRHCKTNSAHGAEKNLYWAERKEVTQEEILKNWEALQSIKESINVTNGPKGQNKSVQRRNNVTLHPVILR